MEKMFRVIVVSKEAPRMFSTKIFKISAVDKRDAILTALIQMAMDSTGDKALDLVCTTSVEELPKMPEDVVAPQTKKTLLGLQSVMMLTNFG